MNALATKVSFGPRIELNKKNDRSSSAKPKSFSHKKSFSGLPENVLKKLMGKQSGTNRRKTRTSISNRVNQFTDLYLIKNELSEEEQTNKNYLDG